MEKVLRLYKYIDGINDIAFPNEKEQAIITSFRYDAKRMGEAPTISFSLMHSLCLDSLWDNKVYALFNGERFYVKQTPTSSYSSSDTRYKHEVELVSERFILDNIYFYDVVSSSNQDKPVSNSSKFSFFGNIEEFVSRLNNSLNKSNVGYRIVIDDDILSDEALKSIESQVTFEDQVITNALQEIYNVYKIPYYFVGKTIHVGYYQDNIDTVFKYGCDNSLISISKTNANSKVINKITGVGSSDNIPYYYPNVDEKGITQVLYNGREGRAEIIDLAKYRKVKLADKFVFNETIQSLVPLIDEDDYSFGDFRDEGIDGDGKQRVSIDFYYSFTLQQYENVEFSVTTTYEDSLDLRYEIFNPSGQYVGYYKEDKKLQLTGGYYQFVIRWSFLSQEPMIGSDDVIKNFVSQYLNVKANIVVDSSNAWTKNNIPVTLSDYGISVNSPSDGDVLTIERLAYIQPQPNLVPPIYRNTEGGERFYEAINGKYKNEQGVYYQFDNEYTPTNPREHIENFDDIKPTIKNVVNGSGYYIDEFIDFAYDLNDNDETDESGKFIHPYFFGKLRRFDGEFGFNLFDHAIDEGEMVVSMTSGTCGSCEFVIGVDEQSQKNKVQVDSDGNLVRDNNGNVRLSTPQDRQNDTKNNEVWIALKKDIQTFGVVMPNAGKNYRPKAKDKFVLLHIDLPQKYVEAAENALKDKLIKYMHENNFEKFNFSIAFSRIYFAENPTILANLSENSKIKIEYNKNIYDLYISSLSYSISNDSALPEVKVELEDALSISQNQITQVVESTKREIISSIDKNVYWEDIKGTPTWITSDKPRYSYSELSGRGTSDNSNDVWVVKKDEKGNSYVYTKLDVVVERGVTMYGTDGSVNLPSIYDGLPLDNDTIYWEEIKDEEGNVIAKVLKSRGVGEGGVTPTLLGDLTNVGGWANAIATEDRIMVQKKDSSSWEALELSKIGGSASFENVKESGEGNAFTSFTLSEDKKTLTFVKGETFARQSDHEKVAKEVEGKADKATTLSGYGITNAYTKTQTNNLLSYKWTEDSDKIANWDAAYGWGNHADAGYATKATTLAGYGITNAYTKAEANGLLGEKADWGGTLGDYGITDAYTSTEVDGLLEKYLPIVGGTITGNLRLRRGTEYTSPYLYFGDSSEVWLKEESYTYLTIHADGGVKIDSPATFIDGIKIEKSADGVLYIDADLVVKGGVTMFANEGSYTPSTIMDAVSVDNQTIIKQGGKLMVNPELVFGGGGGEVSTVTWGNVLGKPTWITDAKPVYKYTEISGTPDLSVYALTESLNNYQSKITTANKLSYSLIDDTPDLSVYATKGTSLSHYGISDAYTKTNVDSLLSAKWTRDDVKISNWDTAYSWGDHSKANYATKATTLSGYGITNAYTKGEVDGLMGDYLPLSGGEMTGGIILQVDTSVVTPSLRWGEKGRITVPSNGKFNILTEADFRVYTGVTDINKATLRFAISPNGDIGAAGTLLVGKGGYLTNSDYTFYVYDGMSFLGGAVTVGGSISPYLSSFYSIGSEANRFSNVYTDKVNVGGISIERTDDGVIFIDGNVVVSGGITMYGTNENTAPLIWDDAPIANTQGKKGVASYDPNYFSVNNGVVTFVGQTGGGGGVDDSVFWKNVKDKPTWITDTKPSYTTSEVEEGTNLYFTNARAVLALSSTLSNYLPLSGGTINGMVTIKPTNIAGVQDGIVLHEGGYGFGESLKIKWTSESYKTGLSLLVQQNNESLLFENSDGFNTVWHSGNDGKLRKNVLKFAYSKYTNGSYRDADCLDGGILINYNTPSEWKNTPADMSYGAILDISYDLSRDLTGQLAWDVNQRVWFRTKKTSSWTPWREFVFADSGMLNAETANKLKTARTLWGNSFNGSSDIKNADITLYQNESSYTGGWARAILSKDSSGTILSEVGFYGASDSLTYTYIGGRYSAPRIVILANGKVGVGTTSPQYDFDVNGSTRIQGTSVVRAVKPESTNSYSLGDSSYLWSNVYTKKANIDGIEIKKSANDVLYIGGNLVVSGGITMYGIDGTTVNTIWDSAPIASTSVKGIASFDSNFFAVNNGKVTFVGKTGGGVVDSVSWLNVTGKPTWIGNSKPSYTTSEVTEDTNLYFTNARAVSALTETLKGYVTLSGAQTISGEKNFTGGLKVNGSPIVYNAAGKYWKLEGDLLVTGGITMFGNDSSFSPSTITQAVNVDGTTIINDGTKLMLNPNLELGGGITNWSDLKGTPNTIFGYGITDAYTKADTDDKFLLKSSYTANDILTKLKTVDGSQSGLDADKLDGQEGSYYASASSLANYLPLSGGTLTNELTGTTIIANDLYWSPGKSKILSATGWYRFATSERSDASGNTYILSICRHYVYNSNESYLIAVTLDYSGCSFTQLAGHRYSATFQLVTKIRCTRTHSGSVYFDFYYNGTSQNNMYVNAIGHCKVQKPTATSSTLTYTDEFSLEEGVKSSLGFIGNLTGNADTATSATTATTASKLSTVSKTAWGQTYWTSGGIPTNISGDMSSVGSITPSTHNTYSIGYYGNGFAWSNFNCISSGAVSNNLWLCGGTTSGIGVVIARSNSNTATGELCRFTEQGMVWASGVIPAIVSTAQDIHLRYNNADATSIVLNGTSFKPFINASNNLMLGRYDSLWNGLYVGADASTANNMKGVNFCDAGSYAVGKIGASVYGMGVYTVGTLYLRGGCTKGANGTMTISNTGAVIDESGNMLVTGGVTMYSDLRKKTILNHVELSLKEVADAPLIEHYYNSDESKRTHVGSVAQYWAGLNDWFCKEDGEGFLTMEIQNAALASAISVARELTRYESKTDKQIKKLKKRIGELEEEIENLKKV